MRRWLIFAGATLALLGGCATPSVYRGVSAERLWHLSIDWERITIAYNPHNELTWPSPRRRDEGGVRVWVAGGGGHLERVRIEARARPCDAPDGNRYADTIRIVRMGDGRPFVAEGCGGTLLRLGSNPARP
jgi:hypothetical protein